MFGIAEEFARRQCGSALCRRDWIDRAEQPTVSGACVNPPQVVDQRVGRGLDFQREQEAAASAWFRADCRHRGVTATRRRSGSVEVTADRRIRQPYRDCGRLPATSLGLRTSLRVGQRCPGVAGRVRRPRPQRWVVEQWLDQ